MILDRKYILFIALLLVASVAFAQQYTSPTLQGDTLNNQTITEDEAKGILKGLFDVPRLAHSLALGRIAKDERLIAYTDGFMERMHIEVLTIGYIDSEEFWPRIFRQQRLSKIDKTDNDNLIAAEIIFFPVSDEATSGYNTTLELTGKIPQVYELLRISQTTVDSIAAATTQEQLGNNTFSTPNDAQVAVMSALIAALEKVEGESQTSKDQEASEEAKSNRLKLIQVIALEGLNEIRSNIENWTAAQISGNHEIVLYEYLANRKGKVEELLSNVATLSKEIALLIPRIDGDVPSEPTAFRTAANLRLGEASPHLLNLSVTLRDGIIRELCVFAVEGVEEDLPPIVGLTTNRALVAINSVTNPFKPDDGRMEIVYSLADTTELEYSKLEIFKLVGEDTLEVNRFMELASGEEISFREAWDQDVEGWSGNGASGEMISEGAYFVKLTASIDENYENGFYDYQHFLSNPSNVLPIGFFNEKTTEATAVATKYTGNETSVACNICVRAALFLLKTDSALFPTTGSGFNDPENNYISREIKGYISDPGRAKEIKVDLDAITTNGDLNGRFSEIKRDTDEGLEDYLKKLQDKADIGGIIIGTYLNKEGTSGHVMMVTPGGVLTIDETVSKWGASFSKEGRDITKVPRVLECGTGARESNAPLCRNIDYNGARIRLKWFEYKL